MENFEVSISFFKDNKRFLKKTNQHISNTVWDVRNSILEYEPSSIMDNEPAKCSISEPELKVRFQVLKRKGQKISSFKFYCNQ